MKILLRNGLLLICVLSGVVGCTGVWNGNSVSVHPLGYWRWEYPRPMNTPEFTTNVVVTAPTP